MSERRPSARAKKIGDQIIQLRAQHWPNTNEKLLWSRKKHDGFITIPRTMPVIKRILDSLSVGAPLADTYFALWCRVFDQSVVTISNTKELAFESGFSGQRAETTWASRMRALEKLGFIKIGTTASIEFSHVLIFNPHLVIKQLFATDRVSKDLYLTLITRMSQIGANDFDEVDEQKSTVASENEKLMPLQAGTA